MLAAKVFPAKMTKVKSNKCKRRKAELTDADAGRLSGHAKANCLIVYKL